MKGILFLLCHSYILHWCMKYYYLHPRIMHSVLESGKMSVIQSIQSRKIFRTMRHVKQFLNKNCAKRF